ncbi:MAG: hypothetical protein B7X57_03210, partial [Erythrobacter sp. 34-65-8]
ALSATHSVAEAARSVGMSRQSAYRLRSKLKGQAFDLAWEVAFHHSFDVLAHAALDRALNGVEVPVYYKGELVGSYRRFDERLTVALMNRVTLGGVPLLGRLGPHAERQARDFETLLGRVESGEPVALGLPGPGDPGELESILAGTSAVPAFSAAREERAPLWPPCPSALSDAEIIEALQDFYDEREG